MQQRKALIARRLQQHGIHVVDKHLDAAQRRPASSAIAGKAAPTASRSGQPAAGAAGTAASGSCLAEHYQTWQQACSAGGQGSSDSSMDVQVDVDGRFYRWMRDISGGRVGGWADGWLTVASRCLEYSANCMQVLVLHQPACSHRSHLRSHAILSARLPAEGRNQCLTPSRWGSRLAPHLTAQQSAEIYTGKAHRPRPCCLHRCCSTQCVHNRRLTCLNALRAEGCRDYVPPDVLREAQQWANFAIAAYGSNAFLWNQPR